MAKYYKGLKYYIQSHHQLVKANFLQLLSKREEPFHDFQPEFVYWKRHQRKTALEPQKTEPCQVLLTTNVAVK